LARFASPHEEELKMGAYAPMLVGYPNLINWCYHFSNNYAKFCECLSASV